MKWVLYALTCLLLLVGGIGWLSGFHTPPWVDSSFEMPLGQLEGIAVDSSGHLYCASQFYSRIQKYDPNGRFLVGWPIDCAGGAFRIRMNQNDELDVATARKNMFYRFSSDGKLLGKKHTDLYAAFGSENKKQCRGDDGSLYRVESRFMFPSVSKISPTGKETTVVSTPFRKWIIKGPLPAWLFGMAGVLILMGLNRDRIIARMTAGSEKGKDEGAKGSHGCP